PRERLAAIVGVTADGRVATVKAMVARHGKDRIAYWLPLILSMGIATYGLVLGSTGVVIGAMLVSPLMGPLVEIGMGLAVGSPLLVLHSTLRTAASLGVVIGMSALLTLLLPYHEVNAEILARTSPTLLDLYVASFCALAAAYTTVRQGSDTVTAAAGTAISIALVPPLCVVGWGLGSAKFPIARGAALLFTANFCAILLFAVLVFLLLGYDAVDLETVEAADSERRSVDRLALRLRSFFGSKYGPALRLLMPIALVAAVFVPLQRALSEVAWTARVRGDVQRILDGLPPAKRAVRTTVLVERHAVSIRLIVVGEPSTARDLKRQLEAKVAATAGISPSVDVVAVPDFEAVRLAAESMTATPAIPAPPKPDVDLVERELDAEIHRRWPDGLSGGIATWRLVVGAEGSTVVEVVHFGAPLGEAGEKMLASALNERISHPLMVRDLALPLDPLEAQPGHAIDWLPSLIQTVDRSFASGVGFVCVTSVPPDPKAKGKDADEFVNARVIEQLARLPAQRVTVAPGKRWAVRLSPSACPGPALDAADAGTALDRDR
ncbi:MAG: DUF389 domain-containing protein, partial [Myxococcota bacterium]|nr:DUF389 domain-containing protein [Myxococcota bacterium]